MSDDIYDVGELPLSTYEFLRSHPAALFAERTVIHIAARIVDSARITGLDWPSSVSPLNFSGLHF